jgi:hypothetical protein
MVAMAEVVVVVLLAAVFFRWFLRTPTYRARRRSGGGVPVQFSRPGPTFYGQRTNVPPPRPELRRPERDSVHRPSRRWWVRSERRWSHDAG